MRAEHASVRPPFASPAPRRTGIGAAMLLALFATPTIAGAPVTDASGTVAKRQHLQGLLWLHSPDYVLVSPPPATPASTATTQPHSDP